MGFDLSGQGKTALITGGAQGIGGAMADTFAEAGYSVVIVDVDAEASAKRVEAIQKRGHSASYHVADVASEASVEALFAAVLASSPRVDVVINNAGISGHATPIQDLAEAELDAVLGVDLKGPFFVCKHAVRALRKQGGGAIINVASISAETGAAMYAPYSAAKSGVIALTRSIARNVGRFNIRVNCINPGSIRGTRLLQSELGRELKREEEMQIMAGLLQKIPLARVGQPKDVAHLALFLASPLAAHVHGAVLTIDGGEHLGVQG